MSEAAAPSAEPGGRRFAALGRWIARHPWYPVVFWVALLVVCVPFLPLLGSVTTNSTDTVPSAAPSAEAAARLATLFPNQSGGSAATVLLYGPSLVDAHGQRAVLNVSANLSSDRGLSDIASVETVYSVYASYLAGEVRLAGGALGAALAALPSLPVAVNASSALLWGPPATFLAAWEARIANVSKTPAEWDYPAYRSVAANSSSASLTVLNDFYAQFNQTLGCAADAVPGPVSGCADNATRAGVGPSLASIVPAALLPVSPTVLDSLGVLNASQTGAQRTASTLFLSVTSGLPARWFATVWAAYPGDAATGSARLAYADRLIATTTLAAEPLPVPPAILGQFVDAAGTASIVEVSFSVADDYTNASGGDPVYADLGPITSLSQSVARASDRSGAIQVAVTGPAPLDQLTQQAVDSSLALVLPLTVGLLLGISMAYFRSPLTPMVTFAGLGIALVLGLGGTVLIGTLIEHVDSTALTLEEVFVLGVGTDYSIFLVARYREELVRGRSSAEAVETAMRWAGQSVATSGSTAILVTVALAASGVALLAQWGLVLSVAILITMLLSLTLVPAALTLIGPRIFWPTTGARFHRQATRARDRADRGATYFHRAGRLSERRAGPIVGAVLLVSVPLVVIALSVQVSYDYYGQLPAGHPATDGLADLDRYFGPGFATPSYALVTFSHPLIGPANATNAVEFGDLANLTSIAQRTSGIASVGSPVGPDGAPRSEWVNLSTLPPAVRANLLGLLSGSLGADGVTVLVSLVTSATGLSQSAVGAIQSVDTAWSGYSASHPEIESIEYGGAAPTIRDLAAETTTATELMLVAVAIGLIAVLVVVLRSWIIALLAIGTIGLSIAWSWAISDLVFDRLLGFPLFFYVRTILIMLVLGLGIDYNIFLLTRVREERMAGRSSGGAATEAVARTGGIITAAAVILASAFGALLVAEFTLIRAIGFAVAIAVILDAMVVRTYLVPSALQLLGDRVWSLSGRRPRTTGPVRRPAPGGESPPSTP